MRLLFLIPHPLLPSDRGPKIYTLALLRELTKYHDCDVLGFSAPGEPTRAPWQELEAALPRLHVLEVFEQAQGRSLVLGRARCLLGGLPVALARYESSSLRDFLARADLGVYGAVCFDMFLLAGYRDAAKGRPTMLLSHDAYSLGRLSGIKTSRTVSERLRMMAEAVIQLAFERRFYGRFSRTVVVSSVDAAWLDRVTSRRASLRVIEIPVSPEAPRHRASSSTELVICWATLSSEAVARGVATFISRAWPAIHQARPQAKLVVWGQAPVPFLKKLMDGVAGLEHVDFVSDWRDLLGRGTVFVYPQRCGSGQQTKVQSAMALGLPVVTAPETAAGLGLVADRDALVCSDAGELRDACLRLLADDSLREQLAASALRHVQEHFDPTRIGLQLKELVEELARTPCTS